MLRRTVRSSFFCCQSHLLHHEASGGCGASSTDPHGQLVTTDYCFEIKPNHVRFGVGALREVGRECRRLDMKRVMVFSDRNVASHAFFERAIQSLRNAQLDVVVCLDVAVEPTDASFMHCGDVFRDAKADGAVSIGGGSVMDTTKAAIVWAGRSAEESSIHDYFGPPVGHAKIPMGRRAPHIACPTTCGTGSECTPIAVCDVISQHRKAGISHASMTPTMAIVDPEACYSLPPSVIAASGFDVLSHAIESYTARSFTDRPQVFPQDLITPVNRPATGHGRNPYTDIGCLAALERVGTSYLRAVADPSHLEAIRDMVFASTVAGTAMGSAGCHIPHAMSYPVSGSVPLSYHPPFPYPHGVGSRSDFPPAPKVIPHGCAVGLHTPAVVKMLQQEGSPDTIKRLKRILQALGVVDDKGCDLRRSDGKCIPEGECGHVLAEVLVTYLKANKMPSGLLDIGFQSDDMPKLAKKCQEKRLLQNAPFEVTERHLVEMYKTAAAY